MARPLLSIAAPLSALGLDDESRRLSLPRALLFAAHASGPWCARPVAVNHTVYQQLDAAGTCTSHRRSPDVPPPPTGGAHMFPRRHPHLDARPR
ncbi:hypothetical protein B0H13DRAFT_1989863 [Mycena leptocephala]|nr:hypothetical protein B0H13DRAFT_1989863 [Mycena leptocephala]